MDDLDECDDVSDMWMRRELLCGWTTQDTMSSSAIAVEHYVIRYINRITTASTAMWSVKRD